MLIEIHKNADVSHCVREHLQVKVLLADTSFLLNWQRNERDKKYKNFVQQASDNGCTFFRNVTVQQELLSQILYIVVSRHFYEYISQHKLEWITDERKPRIGDSHIKLLREKNPKLLQRALQDIPTELELFNQFPYTGASSSKLKGIDAWGEMLTIMSKYGLNAADAMIANFVLLHENIDGLVTSDCDFVACTPLVKSHSKNLVYINDK